MIIGQQHLANREWVGDENGGTDTDFIPFSTGDGYREGVELPDSDVLPSISDVVDAVLGVPQ